MPRLLVLFFILLMPLQFAWSAASAYCQHETTTEQSRHFGHHFHDHQAETEKPASGKLVADPDCASCHASGTVAVQKTPGDNALVTVNASAFIMDASTFTSASAREPDRPQWLRLV